MAISPIEFDYLRKLMRERTAIVIDQGKEYIAESRLAHLIAQEGFSSVNALIQQLRSNAFNGLHRKVINAMTNNETWFFRDFQPFEALRTTIIPALLASRGTEKTLRIWSAACSSGQEPYSLAMMLQENFPELRQWRLQILATDVCTSVLLKAERGRYSQLEMNRGLPVLLLSRYFIRQGVEWELTKDIRAKVEFRVLNLAENWPALPAMDVILLRNVLIYFDVETKKEILGRVRRQLRPDGYMLMGGAETTLNLDKNYERVQFANTAYYRPRS